MYAGEWIPDIGLLLRPRDEPPRMLNQKDLDATPWNEMPTLRYETALHLLCDIPDSLAALEQLAGYDVLAACIVPCSIESYLEQQRTVWLSHITEPAFRAHDSYLTWLEPPMLASSWHVCSNGCCGLQWLSSVSARARH
ncbi:hypothetical protein [Silvibacterium sp.]|uniref:hypothetical protein n=1 Tax=Silvibacterium sp. TaxID=1964179 RepID=UPI0039E4144E